MKRKSQNILPRPIGHASKLNIRVCWTIAELSVCRRAARNCGDHRFILASARARESNAREMSLFALAPCSGDIYLVWSCGCSTWRSETLRDAISFSQFVCFPWRTRVSMFTWCVKHKLKHNSPHNSILNHRIARGEHWGSHLIYIYIRWHKPNDAALLYIFTRYKTTLSAQIRSSNPNSLFTVYGFSL